MTDLTTLPQPVSGAERVAFFQEMLEIYSPSHQESAVAEFLVRKMQAWNFREAYVDEAGNAVGEIGATQEQATKTVALLGHIDTVPGFIPVQIMEDGDTIYGRGSVDAKGPFAAFTLGAAALVPLQAQLSAEGKRIVLIGAVEEEAASSKGARYAANRYRPQFCVIGEPSGWSNITLGYKGRLLVDYTLSRDTKHTAAEGSSVCEEAVDFWNKIKAYATELNMGKSIFETLQPSLRNFNSQANGFQEVAHLYIGFRIPVGFSIQEFKTLLDEWRGDAVLVLSGEEEPVRSEKNNLLVRAFLSAIRVEGGQPKFRYKTGTSDMNVLAPVWQCPILAYGPGDSSLDHTPNEHASLRELEKGANIITRMLLDL
ncbi:[LysW]-lysine hydrolase [Candidatus Chlorohelix sp.]|uniref:[LysW]-lysine hydrolase n=1 Tax=Candidatus Chlorohelix sp. TaxID=3139201 RepID=UPI00302842E0